MGGRKQANRKTEERRIPRSLLLALFILICVLGTVQMLARYVRGTSGGNSARVASFRVTSDLTEFEKSIEGELNPGEEKTYTFDFTNDSETSVNMTAKLFSEGNLPLRISYKEGEAQTASASGAQDGWTVLTEDLTKDWEEPEGAGCLSWTDALAVKSGKKAYTIRIEWPTDRNDYRYKEGVLALKLRIEAEQAD